MKWDRTGFHSISITEEQELVVKFRRKHSECNHVCNSSMLWITESRPDTEEEERVPQDPVTPSKTTEQREDRHAQLLRGGISPSVEEEEEESHTDLNTHRVQQGSHSRHSWPLCLTRLVTSPFIFYELRFRWMHWFSHTVSIVSISQYLFL